MELLDLEVRFQQALHCAELECAARGLGWRDFSLLASHRQAFQFRIGQITTRKGVKVNRRSALQKRLKRLPFLRPLPKLPYGAPWFEIFREGNAICALAEARSNHTGIGKEFTLQIALLRQEDGTLRQICSDNFFRVVGSAWEKPSWFYHDEDELNYCLDEMEALLQRLGPTVKRCFEANFGAKNDPLMRELGRISAREAFAIGAEFLSRLPSQLHVYRIIAFRRTSGYSTESIIEDGRLLPTAMWRLFIKDAPMERAAIVDVPFRGPVRGGWDQATDLSPAIEEWMDSTEASRIFAEQYGEGFVTRAMNLDGYSPACWTASVGSDRKMIHCVTGKPILR